MVGPSFQNSLATDTSDEDTVLGGLIWMLWIPGFHGAITEIPSPPSPPQKQAALAGEQGVRYGKDNRVGPGWDSTKCKVLSRHPQTRGYRMEVTTDSCFPRSTSLAMRAGFLTPVLGEERGALTGGRWQSSRLKHSQACKLPLKSLRTWWPTPQAYGKRRKVIACQALSSQWIISL